MGRTRRLLSPNVEVTFVAGLPRKAEAQILEVPEATVYELGTAPGGGRGKVIGLDEGDAHPPKRSVAKDGRPGDAPSDNQEIQRPAREYTEQALPRLFVERAQTHPGVTRPAARVVRR
jgi:hypothetical protein